MLLRGARARLVHRRGGRAAGVPAGRRRADPQARADPRDRAVRPRRARRRCRPTPPAPSPSTRRAACARSRTPPTASASSRRCGPGPCPSASSAVRSAWRFEQLVAAFLRDHPQVTVRLDRPQLVGDRASACATASSRPGSCCCRSTTSGSTCARSCATRCSTSAPTPRAHAASRPRSSSSPRSPLVFYDAESADDDPIRRQLAERAQALRRPAAAARRGRADRHRAAARRRRRRRHLPARARTRGRRTTRTGLHTALVQPGALRHVRDRHALRRAPLPRRARAARGARDAHACGGRRVRPLTRVALPPRQGRADRLRQGHGVIRDRSAAVAAPCTRGCVDLPSSQDGSVHHPHGRATRPRAAGRIEATIDGIDHSR